ncbi:MAG TPA: CRISPR-associated helicase/endonuclease Cas3 [Deltaproteobacteria bacterium]|nr:CRISPR-associated helicase/endonuclease Cas3 [Deltaproteobacteria bacterium]
MRRLIQLIRYCFNYWGKARPAEESQASWHPLVYHSLDVAAVAAAWWEESSAIRRTFRNAFQCPSSQQSQLRAWLLFFIALHDLGKFDLRFQLKALEALLQAWKGFDPKDHGISSAEISKFDHGHAGIAWAHQEYKSWLGLDDSNGEIWEHWKPWLAAVTGHHGDFPPPKMESLNGIEEAEEALIEHDQKARHEFVILLSDLFLAPAGLSLRDLPPPCSLAAQSWLAGYASACDWIGSNTEINEELFKYRLPDDLPLDRYLENRIKNIQEKNVLQNLGLIAKVKAYAGVQALLKNNESPRGVQTIIDDLPAKPGLILIEAPTGSGKTEAALAYAWKLLEQNIADSVVFSLPTQATSNAMLGRAGAFAERVYGNPNVVLAHGKSELNFEFRNWVQKGKNSSAQGEMEAGVQCAQWLSTSRKRVFLGQVGVCTIDQVLLSVLPVRHKFVRGFGLNKSVLIVDEVHAYDAYMHGLLGEVLRRQQATGGSAILLSATLPPRVRTQLFQAWGLATSAAEAPYPTLWQSSGSEILPKELPQKEQPPCREIEVECVKLPGAFPDTEVIQRIITAAESGARVAVVMNLVQDSQRLARLLRNQTSVEVDVFHSRYRFIDRREKEENVLKTYGRSAPRGSGRILVATQVVEQSLDLDFDWMLTQICPVDLLFQRLGRLHRHSGRTRPKDFVVPRCTVLSVKDLEYGLHKEIYGNTRVLWRTEQLLSKSQRIVFPEVYRTWIDRVYERDDWEDEPENISMDFDSFYATQRSREVDAKQLTTLTVKTFRDEDGRLTSLTRDGEMSLAVLLLLAGGYFLDGRKISEISERELEEALDLNAVPVPATWKKRLMDCRHDSEGKLAGYRQLEMVSDAKSGWTAESQKLSYSEDFGLEKIADELA